MTLTAISYTKAITPGDAISSIHDDAKYKLLNYRGESSKLLLGLNYPNIEKIDGLCIFVIE